MKPSGAEPNQDFNSDYETRHPRLRVTNRRLAGRRGRRIFQLASFQGYREQLMSDGRWSDDARRPHVSHDRLMTVPRAPNRHPARPTRARAPAFWMNDQGAVLNQEVRPVIAHRSGKASALRLPRFCGETRDDQEQAFKVRVKLSAKMDSVALGICRASLGEHSGTCSSAVEVAEHPPLVSEMQHLLEPWAVSDEDEVLLGRVSLLSAFSLWERSVELRCPDGPLFWGFGSILIALIYQSNGLPTRTEMSFRIQSSKVEPIGRGDGRAGTDPWPRSQPPPVSLPFTQPCQPTMPVQGAAARQSRAPPKAQPDNVGRPVGRGPLPL